jgi:hypothetical protein
MRCTVRKNPVVCLPCLGVCVLITLGEEASGSIASDLAALTDGPTKVVWIETVTDYWNTIGAAAAHPFGPIWGWVGDGDYSKISTWKIKGLDTDEGIVRTIQGTEDAYFKPEITPNGDRVIWQDNGQAQPEIWICDWDGGNGQKLTDAFCLLGTVKDAGNVEWVYVLPDDQCLSVRRHRIDSPAVSELVYDNTKTGDMWGISQDGSIAAMSNQNANDGGIARYPMGTFVHVTQGCNWDVSSDGAWFWHMDPNLWHKQITVWDIVGGTSATNRRDINMLTELGIPEGNNNQFWYNKWARYDPTVFSIGGPHPSQGLLPSAGDVYVCKLDAGATTVTDFVKVTDTPVNLETQAFVWIAAPPVITSAASATACVGVEYTYTVKTSGNPGPIFSVGGNPGWLTLTGNVLSGTPTVEEAVGPITITATNSEGTDTEVFNILVTSSPVPEITSTAPTEATVGVEYSYAILASGVPVPTFTVTGSPEWLTLNGNVLSGTPMPSDVGTTGQITIIAVNTNGTDSEAFSIEVAEKPLTGLAMGEGCAAGKGGSLALAMVCLATAALHGAMYETRSPSVGLWRE